MMLPRRLLPIFLLLLVCPPLSVRANGALTQALDRILDAPALKGGITGAIVVRVGDGQTLYARNPDTRLLPASNLKLFTSAAALEMLGGDFRFTTRVLAAERPDSGGTVRGDVVLRGVGDSSLLTQDLDDLAAQMAREGVRRITGNILGDGSVFTDGPYGLGWEWDDLSDEEFPQIAGLELNRGDIAVHAAPGGSVGAPVVVTLDPPTGFVPIISRARTGAAKTPGGFSMQRPWNGSAIVLTGALPLGTASDQNIPVMEPPRYAATVFRECLKRHGVAVGGLGFMGQTPPSATAVLASHVSVPLAPYLALMNKPSDNLLAESLVRTLGAVKGDGGNYASGYAVETALFQKLGVDTSAIRLVDGCGVGRRNVVTARAVGQLLLGMHRQADWNVYYDSLPIAGVDGTLRNRLKGTRATGNVHAKTGTLTGVRALSGYVTGGQGDLYAFSLLMNNFPGTARQVGDVQDKFVIYLADTL